MSLAKRVVLSQLEILPDGTIQVRLDKQVADGDDVLSHEYHRTVITPDIEVADQMAAVDAHLLAMGWPIAQRPDIDRIKRIANVEHTPSVKTAYAKAQRAAHK